MLKAFCCWFSGLKFGVVHHGRHHADLDGGLRLGLWLALRYAVGLWG